MGAQGLFVYLHTRPTAQDVPGLMNLDLAIIAVERRLPVTEIEQAVRPLLDRGLVQRDPAARVMRIPDAPEYATRPGPNQIRGWYRRWFTINECGLKYDHLASLRSSFDSESQSPVAAAWTETFGNHRRPIFRNEKTRPGEQVDLFEMNKNNTMERVPEGADPDLSPDQDQDPRERRDPEQGNPSQGQRGGREPATRVPPGMAWGIREVTSPARGPRTCDSSLRAWATPCSTWSQGQRGGLDPATRTNQMCATSTRNVTRPARGPSAKSSYQRERPSRPRSTPQFSNFLPFARQHVQSSAARAVACAGVPAGMRYPGFLLPARLHRRM